MEIRAGRWRGRLTDASGANAALSLRARVFRNGACDRDAFDETALHLLIECDGRLAGCARVSAQDAAAIQTGYTAQFYDLALFSKAFPSALEVGRVCLNPDLKDPEVPRVLLAFLAHVVEAKGAAALYGCTSFPMQAAALAPLRTRTAPALWAPGRKAKQTRELDGDGAPLPPLLRSYLSLGARVSDHAVVDRDLGTVHVFTALPIAAIPPTRARLLTGMLAPA